MKKIAFLFSIICTCLFLNKSIEVSAKDVTLTSGQSVAINDVQAKVSFTVPSDCIVSINVSLTQSVEQGSYQGYIYTSAGKELYEYNVPSASYIKGQNISKEHCFEYLLTKGSYYVKLEKDVLADKNLKISRISLVNTERKVISLKENTSVSCGSKLTQAVLKLQNAGIVNLSFDKDTANSYKTCKIYNSKRQYIAECKGTRQLKLVLKKGTYYLNIDTRNEDGPWITCSAIKYTFTKGTSRGGKSHGKAVLLKRNCKAKGHIYAGDTKDAVQWYKFKLTKSQKVKISGYWFDDINLGFGEGQEHFIKVFNSKGKALSKRKQIWDTFSLTTRKLKKGTYYIALYPEQALLSKKYGSGRVMTYYNLKWK